MCGSLAQKKMWKINYHLRETHLIDNKMMMIKKSTNEEFTGCCTELCAEGVHAKIDYLDRDGEHFRVIQNQWDSINPFRMLNALQRC